MLIKFKDDRSLDIVTLQRLAKRKDLTLGQKKQIKQELSNFNKGLEAEKQAAYELNFYFENHKNYVIIHDLRLCHNEYSAQIDHLIIDRFFHFYVLESKYLANEIIVNENGEFSAKYGNKTIGIPSPIAQNQRHIKILKSFLEDKKEIIPKTLGFRARPSFDNIIALSKNVKISRYAGDQKNLGAHLMRIDNFVSFVNKQANKNSLKDFFSIAQLLFREELKEFAQELVKHHQPLGIDWEARFGIVSDEPKSQSIDEVKPPKATAKKTKKLICTRCSIPIEYIVARFCWFNKKRFGGNTYCRTCQSHYK